MDAKRLSLSNLHEQIGSLKSPEWPTMKRYFRRQIVKCINECKTQACNAKKLVGTIKDHAKNKVVDQSEYDDDDDVGWGSDFDSDDESDENNEDTARTEKLKPSTNKYDLKQTEDPLYEPVCVYGTGFKLLEEESQLDSKATNANVAEEKREISECINGEANKNGMNDQNSQSNSDEQIELCGQTQTSELNGVKGVSPKPSPRVMPKPPTTKPEVPKNKPQIIPRKPFNNNGSKTPQKRPPSEPPPPPLPKSPPPELHLVPSPELQLFPSDSSSSCSNSRNADPEICESVTEDDYLLPNRPETPIIMERKHSSSTLSSVSLSTRDGDSPVGALSNWPRTPSLEDDYESFPQITRSNNQAQEPFSEQNYETIEVKDNDERFMPQFGPRPPLPKVKEPTNPSSSKTKIIPDVFPNLPSWSKSKDRKITPDSNLVEGPKTLLASSDPFSNIPPAISARPLPPLPQPHTSAGNESLRGFEWYHNVEREEAEALLMSQDQPGSYLVRESKRAGKSNPYTLTIFHDGRVFHLNIRKRLDGLYALGKEKPREKTFKTVADLISYHTTEPILLTTRGTPAGKTKLIVTPTPQCDR